MELEWLAELAERKVKDAIQKVRVRKIHSAGQPTQFYLILRVTYRSCRKACWR